MLENFCPLYTIEHVDERFCEGCENLNSNINMECLLNLEKEDFYNLMMRLSIGL